MAKIMNDDSISYDDGWQTSEDAPGAPVSDEGTGIVMACGLVCATIVFCLALAFGLGWCIVRLIEFWAMRGVL